MSLENAKPRQRPAGEVSKQIEKSDGGPMIDAQATNVNGVAYVRAAAGFSVIRRKLDPIDLADEFERTWPPLEKSEFGLRFRPTPKYPKGEPIVAWKIVPSPSGDIVLPVTFRGEARPAAEGEIQAIKLPDGRIYAAGDGLFDDARAFLAAAHKKAVARLDNVDGAEAS